MNSEKVVLDEDEMRRALTRIAHEIVERNAPRGGFPRGGQHPLSRAEGSVESEGAVGLVGIHRRGSFLARRLQGMLADLLASELPEEQRRGQIPCGDIDISFYRDDLVTREDAPVVRASHIDFDLSRRTVVIVDDVLYTGRTVRAAIEALFDYGRPERVQLAVLADRGHRELPIRPDYVGKNLPTSREEHVSVRVRELDGMDEVAILPARVEVGR